jgi:hypothetical protein
MGRALFTLLLLLLLPAQGGAWGHAGHHLTTELAISTLPEPLRAYFRAHEAFLVEHSMDPDLWREQGRPGEGPNHFLDMDAFPDGVDRSEETHLKHRGAEAASRGRVPWRVSEVYRGLVLDFKKGDSALFGDAAALCHYVGDAHVPFHATLNYDGQLTGQKGIHARWESVLVERNLGALKESLDPKPARTVQDPVEFLFGILKDSLAGVPLALASDRASLSPGGDPYGDPYYEKLYSAEADRLRSRLSAAATDIGSLWLSAWREAGSPSLGSAD